MLCERYLTERVDHGKRKRGLDASWYEKIQKEVDRLLQKDRPNKVYELLVQLRDYEMNPLKVPSLLKKNVDGVVEVVDLTKGDECECIDVDSQADVVVAEVKKVRMDKSAPKARSSVKKEEIREPDAKERTATCSNAPIGCKRLFGELANNEDDIAGTKIGCMPNSVKSEPSFKYDSDEESRFSQGCTINDEKDVEIKGEPNDKTASDEDTQLQHHEFMVKKENKSKGNNTVIADDANKDLSQEEIDAMKAKKSHQERVKLRKFGDRVLLARQGKGSLSRLGGNSQSADLWWHNEDDPRVRVFHHSSMVYLMS